MKISKLPWYITLFVTALSLVILSAQAALAAKSEFPFVPVSLSIKENFNITEVPELLLILWFIAWLVESFLEIIQKSFSMEKDDNKLLTREQWTAIVGFIIGIVIFCSGVHILGTFFDFSQGENYQKNLFIFVDGILTAAVIAGGSQGVHKLTTAYKEIVETFKKQNTESQQEIVVTETASAKN